MANKKDSKEEYKEITKEDLFRSKDDVVLVSIELLKKKIPLRPVSDGFWQQVDIEMLKKLKASMGNIDFQKFNRDEIIKKLRMDADLSILSEAEYDKKVAVIQYCLFGKEEVTKEEVSSLSPPGVINEIYLKILEISGIPTNKELVQKFREQS